MSLRKINESTLTAIGNAIRAKTGGSALINPEDMATEIDSIQTGGGGSLPSQISVIDGGSFTLNADTQCSNHWIDHNLGVAPKQVVIWAEDDTLVNAATQGDKRFVIYAQMLVRDYVTGNANDNSLYPVYVYRNTDGKAANTGSPSTAAQKSLYVSATQARLYTNAVYYKANTEYKWIAFA